MERALGVFVEMHKCSLEKSPFVDRETCRRADVPIIKAIIMQFTILSHKSSVVKGFLQFFWIFFEIDKNRQNHAPRTRLRAMIGGPIVREASGSPSAKPPPRASEPFFQFIHTLFPKIPSRICLQIAENMVYYYNL